ncbi:tRNA methyltransferase [Sistotremastrum suecicum HHB10207 ss-3]|uniref:tRNA methyltransferase n=1 Tax=Sistotremastrum suecicum HHB10207 ss-3 TaxID=1314776 RepID=A0A166AKY7_9AGAM|nr:tRNA methyltransferase [Sistotremastrum suecicum HHB10207 ss-3]
MASDNEIEGGPGPSTSTAVESTGKKDKANKKRKKKHAEIEPYSSDDVLWRDVTALLGAEATSEAASKGTEWDAPIEWGAEVEVEMSELASNGKFFSMLLTGECIGKLSEPHPPWVIVVPFVLPGEKVKAKIHRHSKLHSFGSLIEILEPNTSLRDMTRVKCQYFGKCAGCQYQMLSYDHQLGVKRRVVVKAFQNFSNLAEGLVPEVLPAIASPMQYNYRTKITPHFDAPTGSRNDRKGKKKLKDVKELRIGFNEHGRRSVMDIEECPIATPILNEALGPIISNVRRNIHTYKRGATLLLRDSLPIPTNTANGAENTEVAVDAPTAETQTHICVTDHKATIREAVGPMLFEYPAGSFFQNNNSVLVPLTSYVREAILNPPSSLPQTSPPTHLVDTYCGSGLFSITLSPHFEKIAGVEISEDSIRSAKHNAELNNIPEGKCSFFAGKAEAIFDSVKDFPPDRTVVVIDPPRKGCDEKFIEQLLAFRPKTLVYVSCNVHTQARDVGMIVERSNAGVGNGYIVESVRPFDLFPQTAHVESVAVLRLRE